MPNSDPKNDPGYSADVARLTGLYQGGIVFKTLLSEILACFKNHSNEEHKSHFLFMVAKLLLDMRKEDDAYRLLLKNETLFPRAPYARVAADYAKHLFVKEAGRLRPIPGFVPTVQIEPIGRSLERRPEIDLRRTLPGRHHRQHP